MGKNYKKNLFKKLSAKIHLGSIRYSVFLSFTISAVIAIIITGVVFYLRFSSQLETAIQGENQILIDQAASNVNNYLRNMMRLSDSLYYNVIKNKDLDTQSIDEELGLLYTANNNYIQDIVLFDSYGRVLAAAPPSILKDNAHISDSLWFKKAINKPENLHFSSPKVQNLFVDAEFQYNWVVSLSCAVEITRGKDTQQGVLLIDLKYSGLAEAFRSPKLANDGYVYLVDAAGNIISHRKQQLIASGIVEENNKEAATRKDGRYLEEFAGDKRAVFVKSAGYTGWKIVGVIPQKGLTFESRENILFIMLIFLLLFEFLIFINSLISKKLTDPIQKLDRSVQRMELGYKDTEIYTEGSYEIKHLGRSIESMVEQMRKLTDQMVREHEMKQKSELNALQAQINPHFLYNTLDIIVWMVENERPDNAVKLVTALARFFRISLSKGKNIIPVSDEIEHVRSYLTIQEMRYKDKFRYTIDVDEQARNLSIIKLVLQPIVENAIYHSMDFMDGDGLISITARLNGEDLVLSVSDNGIGIPEDIVRRILTEQVSTGNSGSGIGLKNVNERIKLYFGDSYGISIESEPDNGTCITIRLPQVPYGEMEEK
ncbi:MAG: histidine kinase [Oscillospiraceae bacterium]